MSSQPHDALFKSSLTPEAARALCRAVLPPELAAAFEGAELQPESEHFIEEALQERVSDVLYSTTLGEEEALVYVLFEHQSTVDPLMAFRVLRYLVRIWDWWLARQDGRPRRLPLIVPLVVYHGERAWDAPVRFEELVELPGGLAAAAHVVPRFEYVLDDLTQRTDEELRARQAPPFAAVTWIFFRHSHDPARGIEVWRQCADLIQALLAQHPEWRGFLEQLVRYSLDRDLGNTEELRQELRNLGGTQAEEVAVTAAEKLKEKGREEGACRLLRAQLQIRFGDLPEAVEARLRSASSEQLEAWGGRLLSASSLDDVFEGEAE